MKHVLYYNQKVGTELGISNISQGLIFDFLTGAAVWAGHEIIDDQLYYWVARSYIAQQLDCLKLKSDTVYRHLKTLDTLGLIRYRKVGKKDCIQLTEKAKHYYVGNKSELAKKAISETNPKTYVGNKSELAKQPMSEINPKPYVGNKSEPPMSEINPTDTTLKPIQLKHDPTRAKPAAAGEALAQNIIAQDKRQVIALATPCGEAQTPLGLDWRPSANFSERCATAGLDLSKLPPQRLRDILGEFCSYWSAQNLRQTAAQWDHKLLKNMISLKVKGALFVASASRGSTRQANIAQDLCDTSWAEQ